MTAKRLCERLFLAPTQKDSITRFIAGCCRFFTLTNASTDDQPDTDGRSRRYEEPGQTSSLA